MAAKLLLGAPVAAAINKASSEKCEALRLGGIAPALATIRVGSREGDMAYERSAKKRCEAIGVTLKQLVLPENISSEAFFSALEGVCHDDGIHGVLLLRPLPPGLDEKAACACIPAEKDVDGVCPASLAGVFAGSSEGFAPCTARAVMEILDFYGIRCPGKRASVIGRSLVVGRPVSMLLMQRGATVTICHTQTEDVSEITKGADLVVSACGRTDSIGASYFSAGQTVVDVGIGWSERKGALSGDVIFDEAADIVSAITPVPGGVGAVTAAVLVRQTLEAAERQSTVKKIHI